MTHPTWVSTKPAAGQNVIPNESIDEISNYDRGHKMYGMTKWRDIAHAALVDFLGHVENDPSCWERERRSILRGLLMDPQLLLREQSPLVAWATSHPHANDDALELIFALRTAIVRGDADLRVFVSTTKAGLDKSRALDVMNADLYAECALILVEAGHVELLDGLRTQSNRIVSWQLPSTGAFVPAMSHAGPTAATATLMRALSLAHRVSSPGDQAARSMETAWQNGLQTLMNLRIKPADAFCLKSPQDAIGVFRDALACASASAMSTAAVLGALIHGSLMIVGSSSSDQFSSIHASGFDEPSVEARA